MNRSHPPLLTIPPFRLKAVSHVLRSLTVGCLLTAPVSLLPALSAHASETSVAQPSATQRYDINPGPLGQVLSQFASHSGIVLSFPASLTDELQSQGLQGTYSVEQGFDYLLAETNLNAIQQSNGDYVLQQTDQPLVVLESVQIVGHRLNYAAVSSQSASKTDTPLLETSQSISVITEAQLQERQPQTVSEAVAYTAGVRIQGSGLDPRFDTIGIRGFQTVDNGDFLDGLRQPNSGWLSYYSTLPYNLEQIDVLKGPDSVLYGQISPGGLVNRVSKRPNPDAQQEVQIQAGSHDHLQGQFDVGGALNDDVQFRLVGVVREAQTDIKQVDNDVKMLAPTLRWQISDRTDITFISQYQDRQTAASPRPYQQGDTLTYFWAGDEDFDKLDQQQWAIGYELNHIFNRHLELQQNVRYGEVDSTNQYLSAGTLSGTILSRSSVGVYEEMDTLSTDTRLIANFTHKKVAHKVVLGLDFAELEHDVIYAGGTAPSIDMSNPDYSQTIAKPSNVWADQKGQTQRMGIYLQDQIQINNWHLTTGVRRDWVDDETRNNLTDTTSRKDDNKSTWKFGALYAFDNGLSPYFSYSQSFVPQSGSDVSGNSFDPTEGEQFELGIKYQPVGSEAIFTAALYEIIESNRTTTDLDNPTFSVQTGEVRTRGIELEAVGRISDTVNLTASYNYNQAELTSDNDGDEGNDLANTPRHLASLWLNYDLPFIERLSVSGGVRYIGSEYIDNDNSAKNEAYHLTDLAAHYEFQGALEGVNLNLNATNVFDKEHISCEGSYCYRGAGRSIIASMSYRW